MAPQSSNPQMDRHSVTTAQPRYELRRSFVFDAAHVMPGFPPDHPYGRMHGHSFEVEVAVCGEPDPDQGWVVDLAELSGHLEHVRGRLDHQTLNDIEGLEQPTLERIATWIAGELERDVPGLSEVTVRRPSIGQSCTFRPNG